MTDYANARPTKHFFFEMFTRDISLEDCVLDLIDNSVDSLVKTKNINISSDILSQRAAPKSAKSLPEISVTCSDSEIAIVDACGGIPVELAKNDLFSFGHHEGFKGGQLGAYGVGLKRALFKIGNKFEMSSFTNGSGFRAHLDDVRGWSSQDKNLDDWQIPLEPLRRTQSDPRNGTEIRITDLHESVRRRMKSGSFADELYNDAAQTYCLFLDRYVRATVNKRTVEPLVFPLGESKEVQAARDEFKEDGVTVSLMASVAEKPWTTESAGWYILCNGRVVVPAEKTELTGWTTPTVFHDKYRGFLGLAFFQSSDPLKLPWTTTKRNVNRESIVFQTALGRMKNLARPILKALSSFYPPDVTELPPSRDLVTRVEAVDIRKVAARRPSDFKLERIKPYVSTTVKVQFDAPKDDIERARKALRKPRMSAGDVGRYALEYFMKRECPK